MTLTAADQEVRAKRIGASEVAAVLGIHPYSGAFDVFARLTMGVTKADAPELMAGRYLERAVIDWYEAEASPEGIVQREQPTRAHPKLDWLAATPDAVTHYPALVCGVEAKTERFRDHWGAPGSDQVPAHYACQVQIGMAVTGLDAWDVPVLFKMSDEFALFHVKRDEAVIDAILTQVGAWHAKHIVGGEMPALDGSNAAAEFLKRRYPGGGGLTPQATEAQAQLVREYVNAKVAEKAAKETSATLRQRVLLEIGNNDGLVLTDSERCSYRADKRGQRSLRLLGFKDSGE